MTTVKTKGFTTECVCVCVMHGYSTKEDLVLPLTNTQTYQHKEKGLTSSGVSLVSGWAWAARRAMAPALILLRLIWRSGGGPPLGWPRTMMAQPERTWRETTKSIRRRTKKKAFIQSISYVSNCWTLPVTFLDSLQTDTPRVQALFKHFQGPF